MSQKTTFVILLFLGLAALNSSAAITGAMSAVVTNNSVDYFYASEIDMLDAGGMDRASSANGSTATSSDPGTTWGAGPAGAIDDVAPTGPCCGNAYHTDTNVGGQTLTIDFGGTYDIETFTYSGRADGCCPERGNDFTIVIYDGPNGTGSMLASVQALNAGTDSLADFQGGGDGGIDVPLFPVVDTDGDGLPDSWETLHGLDPGSDVGDDGADGDPDGDGLTNIEEFNRETDPQNDDTDDDGLLDNVETGTGVFVDETDTGTDPDKPDTDDDGLLDGVETNTGIFVDASDTGTDPHNPDTDGDRLLDGVENPELAFDPANPTTQPGSNPNSADTDGDGVNDNVEARAGYDPTDPNSKPPSQGSGSVNGVRSVKITNTRADWFYIEEIEILNSVGVDVASLDFLTTATANSGPGFGSRVNGAIDDLFGNCCATGWHSGDNAGPNIHMYIMTFPSPQNLDGVVTVWNRQDGCCPERLDGMLFRYYDGEDGTGNLIISQQIDNLAADNPDTISTADGASFPLPAPTTPLAIVDFSVSPATGATSITWSSRQNSTYAVFSASDIQTFVEIDNRVSSEGDETTFEFTDFGGIDEPRRYYRVGVVE